MYTNQLCFVIPFGNTKWLRSPGCHIHIPTIHIHSIATWWCTTTRNVARLDDKPRARGSKRVKTEQNKPSCSKSKQSSNAFHSMQQAGRTGTRNSARSNTDTRWYSDTQTRSSSRSGLRVAAPRRNENSFLSRISIVSRFACAADTDTVHISVSVRSVGLRASSFRETDLVAPPWIQMLANN